MNSLSLSWIVNRGANNGVSDLEIKLIATVRNMFADKKSWDIGRFYFRRFDKERITGTRASR